MEKSKSLDWVCLIGLCLVAMGCRSIWWGYMIEGDIFWVFPDDPPYHLRRIMLALEGNWTPTFDSHVNYPKGADISWPPGMTWLVAGLVKAVSAPAQYKTTLSQLALWLPPVTGTLTVGVVYLSLRAWVSRHAAFLAGLTLAVLPGHVQYTQAARLDHHIFEPLLSWWLIWSVLQAYKSEQPTKTSIWRASGILTILLALLLWPGNLLHLGGLVCGMWLGLLALRYISGIDTQQRLSREAALVFGLGGFLSFALMPLSPWGSKPVFYALSPLHCGCLLTAAGAFWWLSSSRLQKRIPPVLYWPASLFVPGAALLAISPFRHAIREGMAYTSGSPFAILARESRSFWTAPEHFIKLATWPALFGTIGLFFVLVKTSIGNKDKAMLSKLSTEQQTGLLMGLGVSIAFVLPALLQLRFLNAWAPFGACCIACLWHALQQQASPTFMKLHRWVMVLVIGLLVPSVTKAIALRPMAKSAKEIQRFLHRVKRLTPPATPAPYDATKTPRYGILTTWSLGHITSYVTERPTLANNFFGMPWHDAGNRLALTLLLDRTCPRAASGMLANQLRYVVTTPVDANGFRKLSKALFGRASTLIDTKGRPTPALQRSLWFRLGAQDGVSRSANIQTCGSFRMVDEHYLFPARPGTPGHIKLFEVVRPATLRVQGKPGTRYRVTLRLKTSLQRLLFWMQTGVIPKAGKADISVPYPTDGSCWTHNPKRCPVQVLQKGYHVQVGKVGWMQPVSKKDIDQRRRIESMGPRAGK